MRESPQRKAERLQRAREFRDALLKRQERAARGWQKTLAEKLGWRESAISKITGGHTNATVEQMIAIAGGLDAPEILPAGLTAAAQAPETTDTERNVRVPIKSAPTPIPASLRSFLDAHPDIHPIVKWELEQNHDYRTGDHVVKDERFWEEAALFAARVNHLAGGPYEKRGAHRGQAPRKGKDGAS